MGVVLTAPEPVWALGAPLLEGPVWVQRDAALWFVDIKSHRIHRFDPASGERRSWDAPAQVGFCLPAANGKFVAGLQTGLAIFDPADRSFTPLTDPEPALPGNRLNDGTVDPAGRLWFGTMDDGESEATGRIYRLGGDGRCVAETAAVSISNGPAVSPDGRTLYHVDTLGGVIHSAAIGDDGILGDSRVFATIPNSEGFPDGPAVDAEGCVWIGLYNGAAVRRYSPAGELLDVVAFPVGAITKVAFGGPDLRTVYATTASKHLDADGRAEEPHAGDLFAFRVSVPGMPGTEVSVGL
ncbi:SMP-30/gluconolactonase/LRE family protein [Sphingomonas koreensis]|uniref:SMP-30/gluconolactonase/LRE family protein n=1 Tax=Sphingomonas koreensis TaxID=93064 RepID=UPI00082F0D42|nr:SMP-30/gluconolactonase/LRE family protein [Sphingomonas koreensis]PJI88605.1 sugar lactone lactonase YvrE [Sphingomonas koreensis]RSU58817.1 SMP-30/gluconolactonase/LRE family protein [Sphingomonas koreensis]RSU67182.1 SMP-30/gluconolactonase/LRE family protein [Sphingomonas koreensis]